LPSRQYVPDPTLQLFGAVGVGAGVGARVFVGVGEGIGIGVLVGDAVGVGVLVVVGVGVRVGLAALACSCFVGKQSEGILIEESNRTGKHSFKDTSPEMGKLPLST
jgi:hypothetical protein